MQSGLQQVVVELHARNGFRAGKPVTIPPEENSVRWRHDGCHELVEHLLNSATRSGWGRTIRSRRMYKYDDDRLVRPGCRRFLLFLFFCFCFFFYFVVCLYNIYFYSCETLNSLLLLSLFPHIPREPTMTRFTRFGSIILDRLDRFLVPSPVQNIEKNAYA